MIVVTQNVSVDRATLLEKVASRDQESRLRYITTYNPRLPAIPSIFTKNWQTMIDRHSRMISAFPKPPQA